MNKKKVSFNEILQVIYEPPELIQELHLSRKSDYLQRRADKFRYEKLLAPVLNALHRKKILLLRNKYYNMK
jgi:hypothetical protein